MQKLESSITSYKHAIRNRLFLLIYFSVLAISCLAPIGSTQDIPSSPDAYNHLASIVQAAKAIDQGQMPLRIAPLELSGWYYPYFQFYAPSTYLYGGLLFKLISPHNPLVTYQLLLFSGFLLIAIFSYRLVFWLTHSNGAGLLSAAFFLKAPYFSVLVGPLSALNEIIGLGLTTFLLFYLWRYYENPNKKKYLLLISLGFYLLITVHLITFLYSTTFFILLFGLLSLQTNKWRSLLAIFISIAFAVLMASWYLIPIIQYEKFLFIGTSFDTAKKLFDTRPPLSSFFSSTLLKYFKGDQVIPSATHHSLGLPLIIAVGTAIYLYFFERTKKILHPALCPLLILFAIAFFITWSPINFWQFIPHYFLVIQYTMRALGYIIWISTLIFAFVYVTLCTIPNDVRCISVGLLLICGATTALLPSLPKGPISMANLLQKPLIIFNPTAYLFDYFRYPQFIKQIDYFQLDTLTDKTALKVDQNFYIPYSLIRVGNDPTLLFDASFAVDKNIKSPAILTFQMNNKVVKQQLLNIPHLHFEIPLRPYLKNAGSHLLLPVSFKLIGDKNILSRLHVKDMAITKFMPVGSIVDLRKFSQYCQSGRTLHCQIKTPDSVEYLILPMIFYPDLLDITINGQAVPYESILSGTTQMTLIKPVKGKLNNIDARFNGLNWANWVSRIAWLTWGLMMLGIVYAWLILKRKSYINNQTKI